MASLKDLRNRIASVKATQKITKAMQMVAAAKLRRAQLAAEAARPYAQRMDAVIGNIARGVSLADAPALLAGSGRTQVRLLVVMTAERGLCGAFNSSIVRLARARANALLAEGREVKILCVGKKGYDLLRRSHAKHIIDFVDLRGVKSMGYGDGEAIAKRLIAMFAAGEYDVASLFYSRFRSVILQVPTEQRLVPVELPAGEAATGGAIYAYEPDEAGILTELLPRNVSIQLFRALLENAASEQGARMSAMDSATRNAGEMIKKQTMTYNRTRQAMITKELIEIISGAEAV